MIKIGSLAKFLGDKKAKAKDVTYEVGFIEQKTYPDGELVAQVAFWNEYGTISKRGNEQIPPRPFFRTAIAESRADVGRIIAGAVRSGMDADTALALAGESVKDMIVEKIQTWEAPPNADSTIKEKGFNAPLRGKDRLMRNSVTVAKKSND